MKPARRSFIAIASASTAAALAPTTLAQTTAPSTQRKTMPIELPKLPFEDNALAPTISSNTISFHYGKHHKTYVDNLNKLIAGTDLAEKSLVEIVRATAGKADKAGVFNNSAQVWNHTFYWNSMSPKSTSPSKDLADRIEKDFGGMAKFKEQFAAAAMGQFGSGWAWLVSDGGVLKVTKTPNAETPHHHRGEAPSHSRRLGARLLPRLPEQEGGLRRRGPRQTPQLGVRFAEPGRVAPGRRALREVG